MKFLLKKTDNNLFIFYFFIAKVFNVSTSLFSFYPLVFISFQEKEGQSVLLVLGIVYILLALILVILSIIGNQLVYNFLNMTFVDNQFSDKISKKYFFAICSKVSLLVSIFVFFINLVYFIIKLDIEAIIYFQTNYGQNINNLLVLIGYAIVGIILNNILKEKRMFQYVTYSLIPYSVLTFIVHFLPKYLL